MGESVGEGVGGGGTDGQFRNKERVMGREER